MPRPDLTLVPVAYRLNPILAVGRDVYPDTRLILRKLETLFPARYGALLGATKPADVFVQTLLQRYMIESGVFGQAAGLVPVEVVEDPTFNKDRQGFLGRNWSRKELEEGRGETLVFLRNLYGLFEETVLSDGRKYVLGGERPSLADIEGEYCHR